MAQLWLQSLGLVITKIMSWALGQFSLFALPHGSKERHFYGKIDGDFKSQVITIHFK